MQTYLDQTPALRRAANNLITAIDRLENPKEHDTVGSQETLWLLMAISCATMSGIAADHIERELPASVRAILKLDDEA